MGEDPVEARPDPAQDVGGEQGAAQVHVGQALPGVADPPVDLDDVLMLENVRFNAEENLTLKPEEAKKTHLVRKLSSMADVFVNDAFGTAHRSQPTVVGLPMVMRSAGGLLMEKEVSTLSKVFKGAPRPVCMVLGGTKVDDSIDVARNVLDKGIADNVIVIGVVANVFLIAAGYNIGKPSTQLIAQLKYQDEIGKAKEILARYKDRVVMPQTVAVRENIQSSSRRPREASAMSSAGSPSRRNPIGVLKVSPVSAAMASSTCFTE